MIRGRMLTNHLQGRRFFGPRWHPGETGAQAQHRWRMSCSKRDAARGFVLVEHRVYPEDFYITETG